MFSNSKSYKIRKTSCNRVSTYYVIDQKHLKNELS